MISTEVKKTREILEDRILLRLAQLVGRHFGWDLAVTSSIQIATAACSLLLVGLTVRSVDAIAGVAAGQHQVADMFIYATLCAAVTLGMQILSMVGDYHHQRFQERLNFRIQADVLRKAAELPVEYYEHPHVYDQLQRINGPLGSHLLNVIMTMARVGSSLVKVVGYTVLLVVQSWWFLWGTVPIIVLMLANYHNWGYREYAQGWHQVRLQREVSYVASLLTEPHAAKEIRLFGLKEFLIDRWRGLLEHVIRERLQLTQRQSKSQLLVLVSSAVAVLGATWGLASLVQQGALSVGSYVALMAAVGGLLAEGCTITIGVGTVLIDLLRVKDGIDFLERPVSVRVQGNRPFPSPIRQGIRFDSVSFSYPGRPTPAVSQVTCQIKPGQRVAIVGENGSGKTTLVKLLLGLYTPSQGAIYVDGVSLRDIGTSQVYQHITAVFQDFVRYAFTVRENVAISNLDLLHDLPAIQGAMSKVGGVELVVGLPDQWETRLSRRFEGGVDLSVGQWQKIAVARALLRDAQVVVLDEPTASMDPKAEAQFFEHLFALTEGKTALFVSHRLHTTKRADWILVMKDGHLVEQGTHQELIAQCGIYAQLYELQAQWYE